VVVKVGKKKVRHGKAAITDIWCITNNAICCNLPLKKGNIVNHFYHFFLALLYSVISFASWGASSITIDIVT
jgi:hypothetical protein